MRSALEICKTDLFKSDEELRQLHSDVMAEKVMRIRAMYNWQLANPDAKDRQFVDEYRTRYPELSRSLAYNELGIIKALLPLVASASKDFHRWRFNEMILETYAMAKKRKDTKTMEKAASSYAKFNRIDTEDEQSIPYELIVVQPFTATSDPSVLGIKPIPNLQKKIADTIAKYRADNIDIDDVEYEEIDLEEEELFAPNKDDKELEEEGGKR